tara:strand:+ start:2548 stop:2889 length:342 start_codon:yes stop_codon:yes gene_type:complete
MSRIFIISTVIVGFLFISCSKDIPNEEVFNNPLDDEVVEYSLPALTLFPIQIDATVNSNFKVEIFVMGVENLAGSYVRLNYDKTMLQVSSAEMGSIFEDVVQDPAFIYEDDNA